MDHVVTGMHHATAIARDAQRNLDFYGDLLGLKLVKKTVNYDDPEVYHFYFGDPEGRPGTLLTFFPYPGLVQGRSGTGMAELIAFSVPEDSVDYWKQRMDRRGVSFREEDSGFEGAHAIHLEDSDGLDLALIFGGTAASTGQPPLISGIHHVEMRVEGYETTVRVLTERLGLKLIGEKENRFRFGFPDQRNCFLDVVCAPGGLKGLRGSGTFHHLAFATKDLATQREIRQGIVEAGFNVTPVVDRKYFSSFYFREPGGVLLEVATIGPGFTVDEPADALGGKLMLPERLEPRRAELESKLPYVKWNHGNHT